MRIRELFEAQYQTDTETSLRVAINEINEILLNFDNRVRANGWEITERRARIALSQQLAADSYLKWLLTTPKLKASYAKLQEVRKQLEDKINSGV